MDAGLQVRDLHVRYTDGTWALRGVDLDIGAGASVAVVGESGSGKTSLLKALLGLLPDGTEITGRATFAGHDLLAATPPERRRLLGSVVGYVGQDPYASNNPLLNVGRNVAESWRAKGLRVGAERIADTLQRLAIPEPRRTMQRHPHQWSGGMLQRGSIAAATALAPGLLLADEPTSALDAELADRCLDDLLSTAPTALVVTHDLRLAARHVDMIAVCYAGRLVEVGRRDALLDRPQHPYTRALLAALPVRGGGLPRPLPGTPPDLRAPDSGCAFAARCDCSVPACRSRVPSLVDGVACDAIAS